MMGAAARGSHGRWLPRRVRRGCIGEQGRHGRPMTFWPGANRLDSRLKLSPRDYATVPQRFGCQPVEFRVPPGGDQLSCDIAVHQHRLALAWRETRRPPTSELCARFGFSKQWWSNVTSGQRWAGQIGTCALVLAARIANGSPAGSGATRRR